VSARRAQRAVALGGAALLAASGLPALLRRRRRAQSDPRVFVLAYHDVTTNGREGEGVISATRLRRHIAALKDQCRLVTFADAAELLATPGALREDVAALTFDDGYAGNFEAAWPVLREAGAPATIFVTTGFLDGGELWFDVARRYLAAARYGGAKTGAIEEEVERLKRLPPDERERRLAELRSSLESPGEPSKPDGPSTRHLPLLPPPARPLGWDQVREMHAAGVEIGCHTVTHPILAQLPPGRQEEEVRAARDRIAAETGVAPTSFAYPNGAPGDFGPETVEILRAAGFRAACTTVRGSNRPGCDPLRLRRIGVGSDPVFALAARLTGFFDARQPGD